MNFLKRTLFRLLMIPALLLVPIGIVFDTMGSTPFRKAVAQNCSDWWFLFVRGGNW